MPRIPLLGSFGEGHSVNVNARQARNIYFEVQPGSPATDIAAYGTPGLKAFSTPKAAEVRALHEFNDLIWAVVGDTLYSIEQDGTATSRGTLNTSSGICYMADNGESSTSGGEQLMIVDGTDGYIWDKSAGTFNTISDADFPSSPVMVAFINQRFLVNELNSGRFYGSALLDGTTWGGLDFATAEGNPDDLLAIIVVEQLIVLMGKSSTELWHDTGGADFPFERYSDGVQQTGITAKNAWTVIDGVLYALTTSHNAAIELSRFTGTSWESVTPAWLGQKWADELTVDAFGSAAILWSFKKFGHTFIVCTFKTDDVTWVYDASQPQELAWFKWTYWDGSNHVDHRAQVHISPRFTFFENKHYVGDHTNGQIYELDMDTFQDDGDTIKRELIAGPFYGDGKRLIAHELELLMETGIGSSASIDLNLSRDGGNTYGTTKTKSFASDDAHRIRFKRLGSSYNLTFKLSFDSNAKFAMVGGVLEASSGA